MAAMACSVALRRLVRLARRRVLRRGERLAVQLGVGGQGERLHGHEGRGHVGAVDHEHGTSEREVEPRGVGGVHDAGGDPGRRTAKIPDTVMRDQLGHRAHIGEYLPGVREAFGRKPGGADADRRAVGEPHRFDPDQGRAGLQSKLPCQLARSFFLGRVDELAARLAAAGADDFGKSRP